MTFEEWWQTHDSNWIIFCHHEKERHQSCWQAATEAEQERCARLVENTTMVWESKGPYSTTITHARIDLHKIAAAIRKAKSNQD